MDANQSASFDGGLLLSSARRTTRRVAPGSVFGGEEDAAEETVGRQIERHALVLQSDEKVAKVREAALAEDPNVFDYDTHYDAIHEAREGPKRRDREKKSSRYVESLLEKANERKAERELMVERQRRLELEAEASVYGTTESFVTASYKRKMEELQLAKKGRDERELQEEACAPERRGTMAGFDANAMLNGSVIGSASRSEKAGLETLRARLGGSSVAIRSDATPQAPDVAASGSGCGGMAPRPASGGSAPLDDRLAERHQGAPASRTRLERPLPARERSSRAAIAPAAAPLLGSRRNDEGLIADARTRFLARQRRRDSNWPLVASR